MKTRIDLDRFSINIGNKEFDRKIIELIVIPRYYAITLNDIDSISIKSIKQHPTDSNLITITSDHLSIKHFGELIHMIRVNVGHDELLGSSVFVSYIRNGILNNLLK